MRTPLGFTPAQRGRLTQWYTGPVTSASPRTAPDRTQTPTTQERKPERRGVGQGGTGAGCESNPLALKSKLVLELKT